MFLIETSLKLTQHNPRRRSICLEPEGHPRYGHDHHGGHIVVQQIEADFSLQIDSEAQGTVGTRCKLLKIREST